MSLNVFYCGNCTFSAIPRLKCLDYDIAIIGNGPNSTFSRICTETREYVMSMTAVITYIKVAIVRTMSSNKVKFHKLRLNFIVEKVENLRTLKTVPIQKNLYTCRVRKFFKGLFIMQYLRQQS